MERYTITPNKDSGITNNPNDWQPENPRYFSRLGRCFQLPVTRIYETSRVSVFCERSRRKHSTSLRSYLLGCTSCYKHSTSLRSSLFRSVGSCLGGFSCCSVGILSELWFVWFGWFVWFMWFLLCTRADGSL